MKGYAGTHEPPMALALDHIVIDDGCWEWVGTTTKGYGYVARHVAAHRAVYEALVGPIPAGLQIDHLCRNRTCTRPSHLEPVTQRENILRGTAFSAVNAQKTHCPKGHALAGTNVILDRHGWRKCRTCHLARRPEILRRYAERQRRKSAA